MPDPQAWIAYGRVLEWRSARTAAGPTRRGGGQHGLAGQQAAGAAGQDEAALVAGAGLGGLPEPGAEAGPGGKGQRAGCQAGTGQQIGAAQGDGTDAGRETGAAAQRSRRLADQARKRAVWYCSNWSMWSARSRRRPW